MNIKDLIKKNDPENLFDVLINTYKQIENVRNSSFSLSTLKGKSFNNIVISGLGGSAIAGDLLKNIFTEIKYPLFVNRNYDLPSFVNDKTLFIASSYSGNTEEAISSLHQAIDRKCNIVIVTTGGELEKIGRENNLDIVYLEKGFQPRYALGTSFFTLAKIFSSLDLIDNYDSFSNSIMNSWKESGLIFSKENNYALAIAESLIGFTPIIYSAADVSDSIGVRFKGQLNENSKMHSFQNSFPELNHNEIVGWETYNGSSSYYKVIFLEDESYHSQIKKRIEITKTLLSKGGIDFISLNGTGISKQERLMNLLFLCDWISFYCAIVRNFNPAEIDYIHYLKKNLQ